LASIFFTSGLEAAPKSQQLVLGNTFYDDRNATSLSYLTSITGNLSQSAWMIRSQMRGGYADDSDFKGSADLLFGYQYVNSGWKFRLLGGYQLSAKSGSSQQHTAKLVGQIQSNPKAPIFANTALSLTEAGSQISIQISCRTHGLTLGPDASAKLAPKPKINQIGFRLAGIELGRINLSVLTGVAIDNRNDRRNHPYFGISSSLQW
jgi:hypothetical protein